MTNISVKTGRKFRKTASVKIAKKKIPIGMRLKAFKDAFCLRVTSFANFLSKIFTTTYLLDAFTAKKKKTIALYNNTIEKCDNFFLNTADAFLSSAKFIKTVVKYDYITICSLFNKLLYEVQPSLQYDNLMKDISCAMKLGLTNFVIRGGYVYPEVLSDLANNGFDIYVFEGSDATVISWFDSQTNKKGKVFSPWYYFVPKRPLSFAPNQVVTAAQAKSVSIAAQGDYVYQRMISSYNSGNTYIAFGFWVYPEIVKQLYVKQGLSCNVEYYHSPSLCVLRMTNFGFSYPWWAQPECSPVTHVYRGDSYEDYLEAVRKYDLETGHTTETFALAPGEEYVPQSRYWRLFRERQKSYLKNSQGASQSVSQNVSQSAPVESSFANVTSSDVCAESPSQPSEEAASNQTVRTSLPEDFEAEILRDLFGEK